MIYRDSNYNYLEVARDNITRTTYVHKFGNAPDFDFGDGEVDIWGGANDGGIAQYEYVWSTTAAIDSISSSSASDTVDIQIQGLDANLELVTQVATLSGQTRVALTTPLIRVFRAKNNSYPGVNLAGTAYVYENTALSSGVPSDTTKIRLVVDNGDNQTLMALYTVPINYTAYMMSFYASTAGATQDTQYQIRLKAREYNGTDWGAWQLKHLDAISDIGAGRMFHEYNPPQKFDGGTDIIMSAQAVSNALGANISAGFTVMLVEDYNGC
jgi:hypothetical protein